MALRKCPGCKNTIAAETLTCPICGCNPRTRRLRKYVFWSVASLSTVALVTVHLRQHAASLQAASSPAQAVAGTSR